MVLTPRDWHERAALVQRRGRPAKHLSTSPVKTLLAIVVALLLAGGGVLLWWRLHPAGGTVGEDAPAGPVWFNDTTDTSQIDFVHDAGPLGSYPMPQIFGSGAA